jgi:probable FeS assembly SUF system protein SufT
MSLANPERNLTRECKAVLIPSGEEITLPEGTWVQITQTLGGSYTVMGDTFGLARIEGADADALGEEKPEETTGIKIVPGVAPTEEMIFEQLKHCYDPEIPVNIVDLGLVYGCKVKENENGNYTVDVSMTLTAPGCGMGPAIAADARSKILALPNIEEAEVNLVWDPAWNQEMITEEGKMKLGLI